jgi:manganese transport protein
VLGQLVLVLALGTVGTPFALALVLYLLNSSAAPEPTPTLANVGGVAVFLLSGALAANFVRGQVAGGVGPLSGAVLAFAVVVAAATVGVLGKYIREEVAGA